MVQIYWNYKNYQKNLQNFQNDVQISLDNALEVYYANLTEKNHMTFIDLDANGNNIEDIGALIDKMGMDSIHQNFQKRYSKNVDSVTQIIATDSGEQGFTFSKFSGKTNQLKVVRGKKAADSIKLLKNITSIYISIQDDSLKLNALSPLIKTELERKNLSLPFALEYQGKDSIGNTLNKNIIKNDYFKTDAKSKFLKAEESLLMFYPNAVITVLRQGLGGILISSLLFFGIASCLIYLLKVIKDQKQLAEVKNDIVSNITHEFKTPISTIGVALESLQDFEAIKDKRKTKTYLNMSQHQLSKLNTIVEKLLETATLDSEHLELQKAKYNLSEIMVSLAKRFDFQKDEKSFDHSIQPDVIAKIDAFHFENAISNIIDNAFKYGGNMIQLKLVVKQEKIVIAISDNGEFLSSAHKERVFEKFYRVPKGNTHDVKGFGIGLYYSKKIIEKHGGQLNLKLAPKSTTFKITLPHG